MGQVVSLNIVLGLILLLSGCDIITGLVGEDKVEIELTIIHNEEGSIENQNLPVVDKVFLNIDTFILSQNSRGDFHFPIMDTVVFEGQGEATKSLMESYISKGQFRTFETKLYSRTEGVDSAETSSLIILGTYQGEDFELAFNDSLSTIFNFKPPLSVAGNAATNTKISISLDSKEWFVDNNGNILNPFVAESKLVILDNIWFSMSIEYVTESEECNTATDNGCRGNKGNGNKILASVGDSEANEGDGVIQFPVFLSESLSDTAWISYQTQSNSAKAGIDFVETTGTAVFVPGITEITIPVLLVDDEESEQDQFFTLVLKHPEGVNINRSQSRARGLIIDDDAGN